MMLQGHIQDGQIVIDGPVPLANGTPVTVTIREVSAQEEKPAESPRKSLSQRLLEIAGTAEGLPPDASINHDHYLYGVPKKK